MIYAYKLLFGQVDKEVKIESSAILELKLSPRVWGSRVKTSPTCLLSKMYTQNPSHILSDGV